METFEQLFSVNLWLVAFAIWVIIYALKELFPKFFKKRFVVRSIVVFPLIMGVIFMYGLNLSSWEGGAAALHGLVAGFMSAWVRKFVNRFIFGKDIEEAQSKLENKDSAKWAETVRNFVSRSNYE